MVLKFYRRGSGRHQHGTRSGDDGRVLSPRHFAAHTSSYCHPSDDRLYSLHASFGALGGLQPSENLAPLASRQIGKSSGPATLPAQCSRQASRDRQFAVQEEASCARRRSGQAWSGRGILREFLPLSPGSPFPAMRLQTSRQTLQHPETAFRHKFLARSSAGWYFSSREPAWQNRRRQQPITSSSRSSTLGGRIGAAQSLNPPADSHHIAWAAIECQRTRKVKQRIRSVHESLPKHLTESFQKG